MKRRDLLLLPVVAAATGISARAEGKYEGPTGTRIRVEVFSDYQCPGCKQLHESTLQQLRNEYVSSGKVQLVHREFPLPMHPYARQAACLACAADKIGQYRKVSDALFRDQPIWSANGRLDDTLAKVLTPAEMTKLKALAKDPKVIAEVDSEVAMGMKVPVGQTPTMIITANGKSQPIAGAISYPIFKRYIDMLLAAR
jgi:protein-disulfide isomerase